MGKQKKPKAAKAVQPTKKSAVSAEATASADIMEIDDHLSVSSRDTGSKKISGNKEKKHQLKLPVEFQKTFSAAMQTLSKTRSFEFDFERAKIYAASFGMPEGILSNPLYRESLVLTYLRAYKEYTQRKDITFHFPFSLDQLRQRYPQLLAGGMFLPGDHLKLLSWLNWILLAQHALHKGRGNKCLLLKVLAALLEDPPPRSPSSSSSSSSSRQGHAKGSAMTAHFARARSAMYDGETDTALDMRTTGSGVQCTACPTPASQDASASISTTKRKRVVSPPQLYTSLPAGRPANALPSTSRLGGEGEGKGRSRRPIKPPERLVPGGDAAGNHHVSFDLQQLEPGAVKAGFYSDLYLSDEDGGSPSPTKKRRKKGKAAAAAARSTVASAASSTATKSFSETGVGHSAAYTTPTQLQDMLPICTDASALGSGHRLRCLGGVDGGGLDNWIGLGEDEEFELNSSPLSLSHVLSDRAGGAGEIYSPKPLPLAPSIGGDSAADGNGNGNGMYPYLFPPTLSRGRSFDLISSSSAQYSVAGRNSRATAADANGNSNGNGNGFIANRVARTPLRSRPAAPPPLPGTPVASSSTKRPAVCVDASTSTDFSEVNKAVVSCLGVDFTYPELKHDTSFLSWLSNQVTNEHFSIGVALPTRGAGDGPVSADGTSSLFPQAAQTNKQTADFLTTTYFLEPDLLGSPMPPPRLQHSSSAFSTPFSPVLLGPGAGAALGQDGRNGGQLNNRHNPATPRSAPAAPRKAERGYSWGNLQGSTALGPHPGLSMGSIISSSSSSSSTPPSKSLQEVLAGYAPGSNSNSKSYVQNFGAAGVFAGQQ